MKGGEIVAEQKNSVAATTENKNINIPNYHYILKTMKVIVDVEKNINLSRAFTLQTKMILVNQIERK